MALSAFRSRNVRSQLETVDVVHYALTVPVPTTKAPTVVTLHDVQHRDLPELFGPARRSFRRVAYDRATRSASAVIVTSEFVRGRALELLELDPVARPRDPARDQPHALPPRRGRARAVPPLSRAAVAAQEPRPPVRGVRDAAARRGRSCASSSPGGGLERLRPLPDGVERWGPSRTQSSPRSTAAPPCLVFPSLYEGFGLPPLEAMASRLPGRRVERGRDPGGLRRRGGALRPR